MQKAFGVRVYLGILFASTIISDAGSAKRHMNVVNVIECLVDPVKYDKTIRPRENGDPVVVDTGLSIVSLNKVDELKMSFEVEIDLRQKWHDRRLAYQGLNISNKAFLEFSHGNFLDAIWIPESYFEHEIDAKPDTVMKKNQGLLHLYPNGTVLFSSRLTLTLGCHMYFHDFPMDTQVCEISYGRSMMGIIYKWMTNKTETSVNLNNLSFTQFGIVKIEFGSQVVTYSLSNFTILTLYLHLHRHMQFYLARNYIPAVLIVTFCWLSFWVDRNCCPARISLGIAAILSMTTLLIGFGQQELPVVAHMKAIDWYYIGCFVFVIMAFCEYIITHYFDVQQKTRVITINDATGSLESQDEVKAKTYAENMKIKYGMDFQPSPVSKPCRQPDTMLHPQLDAIIEDAFRKIYPLLFIIFNIAYWFTYYDLISWQ